METRLFVLNLPCFFSESKVRDMLKACDVTSVMFASTIHGVMASIKTSSKEEAEKVETILYALKLPAPLGVIRGGSLMGEKLRETLPDLSNTPSGAYSDVS